MGLIAGAYLVWTAFIEPAFVGSDRACATFAERRRPAPADVAASRAATLSAGTNNAPAPPSDAEARDAPASAGEDAGGPLAPAGPAASRPTAGPTRTGFGPVIAAIFVAALLSSPFLVEVLRAESDAYALRVYASRETLVVSSITRYPGWRVRGAKLTGIDTPFLAFVVPAGTHEVSVAYRPASFYAASAISLLTLATLAVLARKRLADRPR